MLDLWAAKAIRRIGRTVLPHPVRRRRKLLVFHLDGVPRPVLEAALAAGRMPFLAGLLRSGAYQLDGAFWGTPASTPAFEAALLFGLRHPDIPAYRWRDRELGRPVRMNAPADAHAIDQRLDRRSSASLLDGGGTAYLTLLRARARNHLSMPALADLGRFARGLQEELRAVPSVRRRHALAHLGRLARETFHVGIDGARWGLRLKTFRHEHEFFANRLLLLSVAAGVAHSRAIIDMVRGVPSIYLVFANFDEVAHRRGPSSPQARRELERADHLLASLKAISRALDEPYDFYLVTDHGHTDATPFEQLRGRTLAEHLAAGPSVPLPPQVQRALLDGRSWKGEAAQPGGARPHVVDSGSLANVYLGRGGGPLEALEVLRGHRDFLARLVASPEVGLVALRRGEGAVAIAGGQVFGPGEVAGARLPAALSKRAVEDALRELPYMANAGDLVVYGASRQDGRAVGFSWEFGVHGGLTRAETESVVCWPTRAPIDLGALGHASRLHDRLGELYLQLR